MRIAPVNSFNNNSGNSKKSTTFKGEPHKSFYKYLDMVVKESENPEAGKIAQGIVDAVKDFMKPLHKDTSFSVYNQKAVRYTWVPFPEPHEVERLVDTGSYNSMFSNKKTGTSFSMNDVAYMEYGGDRFEPTGVKRTLSIPDKLTTLKEHIDKTKEFFSVDKEFNPDTVLYNLMFQERDTKCARSIIPSKRLREFIYGVDKKAERLAPEFNITEDSKPLKVHTHVFS